MINRTLLFGEGLFETWRVYPGRKLPLIEEHLERMSYGCLFFGWPFKKNEAKSILSQTLPAISANIKIRKYYFSYPMAALTSYYIILTKTGS